MPATAVTSAGRRRLSPAPTKPTLCSSSPVPARTRTGAHSFRRFW
ncbi:hypothetical protein I552_5752 [Mycobacterium xenopi 3993]|nr:hypothetical protein I552_5752 [Mycobacterium xenopi 3993]